MNSISNDPPQVSVIIVNWNGSSFLSRCLNCLNKQTFQDFEIIIVDNFSVDGSVEWIKKQNPHVRLIQLNKNKGFAVANNIGAEAALGKWLALLNNDAFPEPDWLENLICATETYTDYTFFGSKLVKEEDPRVLDGIGDVYHVSGVAWRAGHNLFESDCVLKVEEIFSPTAAAALYLKDTFKEVGGFSEIFYMYHEDVDLGFRMRLRGHKCLFVPNAIARHVGSASTAIKSDLAVYHGHRNLVWSYLQNMPGLLFWKYLPAHLIMNVIFIGYYILRGQAGTIIKAKWDAFLGISKVLKQRKVIQSMRTVEDRDIDRVLEHHWFKPYLLGYLARKSYSA
jgi:GT2 family glycosyltransferase